MDHDDMDMGDDACKISVSPYETAIIKKKSELTAADAVELVHD